jgi:hypothetical protein
MARSYYMLIASLPHLPHFTRAERLPINPERLRWRRSALAPADAAELERALDLLQWRRQPPTRSDAEIDRLFRILLQRTENAALRSFVDHRMGERSVMAALRRKQRGLGQPPADEICGVGRWDGLLKRRWDREDFGLAALFPWLGRARQLLAEGNALGLEELLMDVLWTRLSRIEEGRPFGFEAVFAYVFKWDILNRWLSHDRKEATAAFERLVEEAIGEKELVYG